MEEKDLEERVYKIRNHKRYGIFVKVFLNNYVNNIESIVTEALRLRLMKSRFFNHYSTLILKKHSPFTAYVTDRTNRFNF